MLLDWTPPSEAFHWTRGEQDGAGNVDYAG